MTLNFNMMVKPCNYATIIVPSCLCAGCVLGYVDIPVLGPGPFYNDAIYTAPLCGEEDTRPSFVKDFHAYYFTITQIILAFIAAPIISIMTKPSPKWRVSAGGRLLMPP